MGGGENQHVMNIISNYPSDAEFFLDEGHEVVAIFRETLLLVVR